MHWLMYLQPLGCILISDLVVVNLFMHSLPCMILHYLAVPFLHKRRFCMRYLSQKSYKPLIWFFLHCSSSEICLWNILLDNPWNFYLSNPMVCLHYVGLCWHNMPAYYAYCYPGIYDAGLPMSCFWEILKILCSYIAV